MGKKHLILLASFLVAVVGVMVWVAIRSTEPAYRGKRLSEWLLSYDPRVVALNKDEADEAIRHIGTDAMPTLLTMLRSKDAPLGAAAIKWAEQKNLIWVSLADERTVEAARGFEALGSTAKDAVPALIEIYRARISLESQSATAYALGSIGPSAKMAIPQLLQGLTSSNGIVRQAAVRSLGQIHSQPEQCVPALIRALNDPDRVAQFEAAKALSIFGSNATAAVPALISSFKTNKHIRKTAAAALKAIDADAAARAGVNQPISECKETRANPFWLSHGLAILKNIFDRINRIRKSPNGRFLSCPNSIFGLWLRLAALCLCIEIVS
jgi:HEAT repeat protein